MLVALTTVSPRCNVTHVWSITACAIKPTHKSAVVCQIHYTHVLTYLHMCGRVNPCWYPLKYHSSPVLYCTSCLVV